MTKRKHSPTSKAAHEFIKPHKPSHCERIKDGLRLLKGGATYEEISRITGMKESQVWKRMSDLVKASEVYDTGATRVLSSGCKGIVWQLVGIQESVEEKKPKQHNLTSFSQLSLL